MPVEVSCGNPLCQKTFPVSPAVLARGKGKFCSRPCALQSNFHERWSRVSSCITVVCAVAECCNHIPVSQKMLEKRTIWYCSYGCRGAGTSIPPEKRFWSFVEKTATCWVWTGGMNRHGYGHFEVSQAPKVQMGSHVYSYQIAHGIISDGLCVLHHCDNPPCVRPDHLFLGTKADNTADARKKGRLTGPRKPRHGENHPGAKLTSKEVYEIRALEGIMVCAVVGVSYKISPAMVCAIWDRKRWKHLPDLP